MIIGTVALIITINVCIFHHYFFIQKIDVTGLQRINHDEFVNAVFGMVDYRKLLILPGKNYFLVNVNEIKSLLLLRFPIESVTVKKIFPHTIKIDILEKISTIIYDNGKQYSYVDKEGYLVEQLRLVGDNEWTEKKQITTSTLADGSIKEEEKILERTHHPSIKNIKAEMGDYPIVYDARAKESTLNEQILEKKTVKGIFSWFNFLRKKTNINIAYFLINDDFNHSSIITSDGWELRVNLADEIDNQMAELEYLMKEKLKETNIEYVDLRFDNRVYWR